MKIRLSGIFASFLLLICILSLSSCGKLYQIPDTEKDESLPDMIMTDAVYTFGEKGRRPVVMEASTITIYSKQSDKTVLENINFHQEEEKDGEISVEMSGSCDSAVVTGNNTNATLSGNIVLYKKSDNFTIKCENLSWDNKSQIIKTSGLVDVTYEDGTTLKAKGFTAQLDDNIYEFDQIIEGSYTSEENQ